jgi:hypothetical protein
LGSRIRHPVLGTFPFFSAGSGIAARPVYCTLRIVLAVCGS